MKSAEFVVLGKWWRVIVSDDSTWFVQGGEATLSVREPGTEIWVRGKWSKRPAGLYYLRYPVYVPGRSMHVAAENALLEAAEMALGRAE